MKSSNPNRLSPNPKTPTSNPSPAMMFQTPEMQSILKLKQKHEKNISQTIQLIQELSMHKMPQKCLAHNNNYTLYCEHDQKPLCASCMYQNQMHRTHKVHPLNSCADFVKRDCDRLERELGVVVEHMTGLVKHVNAGIARMDRDFPHLVWKIEECYKKLHNFLVEREKEHVNQLRYYKEKMKYQHGALSAQLNKISLFIEEKIGQYRSKYDFEMLLTKRCVFDTLKNSAKIVGDELNIKEEEDGPKLNFDVFRDMEDFMLAKLPQLFQKGLPKKPQKHYLISSSSKRLTGSKSKEKGLLSPQVVQRSEKKTEPRKSQSKQKLVTSGKKTSSKSVAGQRNNDKTPKKSPTPPLKTPPKKERTKSNTKPILKNSPKKDQRSQSKGSPKKSRNSSPSRK